MTAATVTEASGLRDAGRDRSMPRRVYWFLMQIGMIIGFATAWPANIWLIRRGIKEVM